MLSMWLSYFIFYSIPAFPQRHGINPYPPSLQQKDKCTTIKYLVTEMPASVLGKLIRHFTPGIINDEFRVIQQICVRSDIVQERGVCLLNMTG